MSKDTVALKGKVWSRADQTTLKYVGRKQRPDEYRVVRFEIVTVLLKLQYKDAPN
jgi:hypothetical protein